MNTHFNDQDIVSLPTLANFSDETATLWTGESLKFINTGANDPAQDFLTESVILDRGAAGPIFNAAVETSGGKNGLGPAGVRWAVGSISDGIANLDFSVNDAVDPGDGSSFFSNVCQGACGEVLPSPTAYVAHLIEDNIFVDFTFTAWGTGQGASGLFEYIRSTPIEIANEPPQAIDDTFSGLEDNVISGNVLTNDNNIDTASVIANLGIEPINGDITLNTDGSFTYTPNANFNGSDSFTYTASDGDLSDTATVDLTIVSINDAPTAVDDSYSINENTGVACNVLANDDDIDGDSLTASLDIAPTNGEVTLNADGSFAYTPDADFNGSDSFTYTISDGELSDTAIATITVTDNNNDGGSEPITIFGTSADESLSGNSGDNRLFGNGGNDTLDGCIGNDHLLGGDGDDTLIGGEGNDTLFGNGGSDDFNGGAGNDILLGANENDVMVGGDGDDILYGNGGNDLLVGDAGNDKLYGGSESDTLVGGLGNDELYGYGGGDEINTGTGDDYVWLGLDGDAVVVLNAGEGSVVIDGFQAEITRFELGSADLQAAGVNFEQSGSQTNILSNGDLLAVVNSSSEIEVAAALA